MRTRKIIIVAIVCIIVIMQFIRPGRNHSGQVSDQSMMQLYRAPDSVSQIIQRSCTDCHSNNTRYPWYATVEPVGWMLNYHIRNGKAELNLDEFSAYSKRRRISKLKSMKDQVEDGVMPLPSYRRMHKNARLSESEKSQLTNWLGKTVDSLKSEE